jgi:hypothetical protein
MTGRNFNYSISASGTVWFFLPFSFPHYPGRDVETLGAAVAVSVTSEQYSSNGNPLIRICRLLLFLEPLMPCDPRMDKPVVIEFSTHRSLIAAYRVIHLLNLSETGLVDFSSGNALSNLLLLILNVSRMPKIRTGIE